jgi:hypothetical protein
MRSTWFRSATLPAILSLACIAGCAPATAPKDAAPERHHENDGHDHSTGEHSHIGPHNGQLIELGSKDEFHAEMLHDDANHRVTIYILDGRAKENVPISQSELVINMVSGGAPKQYKLAAVTQANELPNMASCFQLEDESLCEALDGTDAKGRLAVDINGKQFVGEIEHHDDHDH